MKTNNWTALFVGDVVLRNDRKDFITHKVREHIRAANISSCNFEAPIHVDGAKPIEKAGTCISQPPSAARFVKDAGFSVINLANNHAYDFGEIGLKKTLETFAENTVIGADTNFTEAYTPKEITVNNIRIGLIAFCESEFGVLREETERRGGYAWVNHPSVNTIIRNMKETYDVVLVQVHAGLECVEQPLPEWRTRYKELIDAGADAVIGSHPHIIQGFEMHEGKPIFYSLGNFCFDKKNTDDSWNTGLMVELVFDGKNLKKVNPIFIKNKDGVIDVVDSLETKNKLADLSEALHSSLYIQEINSVVKDLWDSRYRGYFVDALNGLDRQEPFFTNLKRLIKFLLGREKINNTLILHNTMIESHRYAIVRALSIENE